MNIVSWWVCAMNAVFTRMPHRRRIALLSRQSHDPLDFQLLEPVLRNRFPDYEVTRCCVRRGGRLGPLTALRQLWLAATSSLCIVDGYVPSVSIPRSRPSAVPLPPCVQLWHALGAVKKFGYQSLGTKAGRSAQAARALAMHRGYDVVIAGFEGAVVPFSKAFGYGAAQVRAVGLPRADYLTGERYRPLRERRAWGVRQRLHLTDAELDRHPVVLYAPTFRRRAQDARWHRHYVEALYRALPKEAILVVSGHPLDRLDGDAAVGETPSRLRFLHSSSSIDALAFADYVVTDYSAVAFEAMLTGRKVLFFVPDIEEYRRSPGLNVDPERELGAVTFRDARDLGACIADDLTSGGYRRAVVDGFSRRYGIDALRAADGSSCGRIADVLEALLERRGPAFTERNM